jgi:hypothetical protein
MNAEEYSKVKNRKLEEDGEETAGDDWRVGSV